MFNTIINQLTSGKQYVMRGFRIFIGGFVGIITKIEMLGVFVTPFRNAMAFFP